MRTRPRLATIAVVLAALTALANADTIVLVDGKKIENVIVSKNDDTAVVINRFNARFPDMHFEIPASDVIPRERVKEVVIADPPLEEYRRRASTPSLTSEMHYRIARFCAAHDMKAEEQYHLEQALTLDPTHARALEEYGDVRWKSYALRNPRVAPAVREKEREYVEAGTVGFARAKLAELLKVAPNAGPATLIALERARRSAQEERGVRAKVPLTIDSDKLPGATFCLRVPNNYDPLRPTPLVIGLHGGASGGKDKSIVVGAGEEMMSWLQDFAEPYGCIVACPTALDVPWDSPKNIQLIEALLKELEIRFNVDRTRVSLVGYALGGFGAWTLGQRWPNVWCACASIDGGGDPAEVIKSSVPIYVFHGADDPIVRADADRAAARALLAEATARAGRIARGSKEPSLDFVYAELDNVGHDIPRRVREDVFRWFAGHARPHSKKGAIGPDSSFDLEPTKAEIDAFGDPAKLGSGDAKNLGSLIDDLKKGGSAGQAARGMLGAMTDDATVKAVAALVRAKKSNPETRLLAVQVLGDQALPGNVKLVAPAVDDDDFRVLDAATEALGKLGGAESIASLKKAAAKSAKRFEDSFLDKRVMVLAEYEARVDSFATLLRALQRVSPVAGKDDLVQLVIDDVVTPALLPKSPYTVDSDRDESKKGASGKVRLDLVRALKEFLVASKDPRGRDLLVKIRNRWSDELVLSAVCDQGIAVFDKG